MADDKKTTLGSEERFSVKDLGELEEMTMSAGYKVFMREIEGWKHEVDEGFRDLGMEERDLRQLQGQAKLVEALQDFADLVKKTKMELHNILGSDE